MVSQAGRFASGRPTRVSLLRRLSSVMPVMTMHVLLHKRRDTQRFMLVAGFVDIYVAKIVLT